MHEGVLDHVSIENLVRAHDDKILKSILIYYKFKDSLTKGRFNFDFFKGKYIF